MGKYTLHVGIHESELQQFKDSENYRPTSGQVFYEEPHNSWEQWGEDPWDGGDEETAVLGYSPYPEVGRHVVVVQDTLKAAVEYLSCLFEDDWTLVPMKFPYQPDVIAVITDAKDWEETYLVVKSGSRFLVGTP